MAASVSGSLASWRIKKVRRMEDVSWPAVRETMAVSTISSSLSSRAPLSSVKLRRHAMRSLLREASPRSSLALVSRVIPATSRRALALAFRLRWNLEKKAQRKKKCCSRHEGKKGCREEAGDEEVGAGPEVRGGAAEDGVLPRLADSGAAEGGSRLQAAEDLKKQVGRQRQPHVYVHNSSWFWR